MTAGALLALIGVVLAALSLADGRLLPVAVVLIGVAVLVGGTALELR